MPAACRRLSRDADTALRRATHEANMHRKRVIVVEPGFTPVPNRRVDAALAVAHIKAKLDNPRLSEAEAVAQGRRNVAGTLPAERKPKLRFRPTKNADPAYRKGIWPASKLRLTA